MHSLLNLVHSFFLAFPWLEQVWTPKRFPRLVVLQSGGLPQENYIYRSFNFNKIRTLTWKLKICVRSFFFSVEQQFFVFSSLGLCIWRSWDPFLLLISSCFYPRCSGLFFFACQNLGAILLSKVKHGGVFLEASSPLSKTRRRTSRKPKVKC